MSQAELQALAESMLAPDAQTRLNDLLTRSQDSQLTKEENTELDQLLEQVDQLTISKRGPNIRSIVWKQSGERSVIWNW